MLEKIIIGTIAGLLAGVGTGFAGLSAAVFISPMLISFLGQSSYSSIGIALFSDVLASAVSAYNYHKNGNTDIKRGKYLMMSVIFFSIVGSVVAYFLTKGETGDNIMGYWLIIATLGLGVKFLFFPGKKDKGERKFPVPETVIAILCGIYVGFVCGFQGTGGGLMMLFVLNILLAYEFKKAVGTSVMIMSVTALIGALSHFMMNGLQNYDVTLLIVCMVSTFIGAQVSSAIANKGNNVVLKRITGGLLALAGVIMLVRALGII